MKDTVDLCWRTNAQSFRWVCELVNRIQIVVSKNMLLNRMCSFSGFLFRVDVHLFRFVVVGCSFYSCISEFSCGGWMVDRRWFRLAIVLVITWYVQPDISCYKLTLTCSSTSIICVYKYCIHILHDTLNLFVKWFIIVLHTKHVQVIEYAKYNCINVPFMLDIHTLHIRDTTHTYIHVESKGSLCLFDVLVMFCEFVLCLGSSPREIESTPGGWLANPVIYSYLALRYCPRAEYAACLSTAIISPHHSHNVYCEQFWLVWFCVQNATLHCSNHMPNVYMYYMYAGQNSFSVFTLGGDWKDSGDGWLEKWPRWEMERANRRIAIMT